MSEGIKIEELKGDTTYIEYKEYKKLLDLLGSAPDIHETETPVAFMAKFEAWVKRVKEAIDD